MPLLTRSRIVQIPESCGGTLTGASITGLTPDRFEQMAATEYNLARVIAEAEEARAVGVVPRALHELLTSRIKEIGKGELQERKVGMQSIVLPYTYRNRKSNISSDYFKITAGVASPAAGTTVSGVAYPASAWKITVSKTDSPYASDLTNIERYFLPGQYVFVENLNAAGAVGARTAYMSAFKIIAAANVSATTADITIAPSFTAAGWTALSAPAKVPFQPTYGVVQIGANNVDDRESWCNNEVAENVNSLIVDWHQTSRYTQCYNDEYARILKEILNGKVNEYLSKFQQLPLAEQNKKQRMQFEKKWMNSVFYGDRINELQTPENYHLLPAITDPDDGSIYGYKANALGIRSLLAAESRIIDAAGGPLDLDLLFQIAYDIKRNRENDGSTVECVDFMTDKDSAHMIDVVLNNYLRATYGYNVTQFAKPGEVRDDSGAVRFRYKTYDIPLLGCKIAVFVDQYFTDRAMQFGTANNLATRGRAIWGIDWTDFDIGITGTNQAKREYRGKAFTEVNPLFSCVITPNAKNYELRSKSWTVRLGDAKRHTVIENFDLSSDPVITLPGWTNVPATP